MINVYRKQDKDPRVLYEQLKERIRRIRRRYEGAKIICGGDFNDNNPPEHIEDLKLQRVNGFTRLNI